MSSSTTLEVAKYIHMEQLEHMVKLDTTEILTTETRWLERGVKEANYIRALNASHNRDGEGNNLPPVWDSIIKKRVKAVRLRRGARYHRHSQRPQQHRQNNGDDSSQ